MKARVYNRASAMQSAQTTRMSLISTQLTAAATTVLAAYDFQWHSLSLLTGGLINTTLRVETFDGPGYVLQRLHPVFDEAVNHNLDLVTRELARQGLTTPLLIRTREHARAVPLDGAVWRVLSRVPGHSVDALSDAAGAQVAGTVLGRFHAALADWHAPLPHIRPPVHDPARHLAALRGALAAHPGHRLYPEVVRLALAITTQLADLPAWPAGPARLVHGDPKISNLLFDAQGRGLCLVDLDTLAHGPVVPELGDAFRSWCNPGPEDAPQASFALDFFAAAIEGYASQTAGLLGPAEWTGLVAGTQTIYLELAARFAADALEERYFGWSPARYATRGEHNLARAGNQLAAAQDLAQQAAAAQAILVRHFTGGMKP